MIKFQTSLDPQRHVEAKIVAVVVVASEGFILVLDRNGGGGGGGIGRQIQRNQLVLVAGGDGGDGRRGQLVLGRCGE